MPDTLSPKSTLANVVKLPRWVRFLLEVGIHETYTQAYNSKVGLYNQMNLLVCLAMIPIMIVEIVKGLDPGLFIALSIFLTTGISFWFMHKGKFFLVAWSSILIVTVGIIVLILFYGRDIGGELTFIAIGLSCIIIFDSWKSRVILLVYIFSAYIVSEILLHNIGPFRPAASFFPVYLIIFGTNFLTTLTMVVFFTKRGEKSEQETEELLIDLKVRNEELEKANYDLAQFAYAASHHFKSPLKNISNLLGLIKRKLPADTSESYRKYLGMILADSRHLYLLVEDILTYSTLDSSSFKRSHLIEIEKVLARVTSNLTEEFNSKNVKLSVGELPKIYASETHVELMLQILIHNGFHFNTAVAPLIEISGTEAKDGSVALRVTDNGIGIAPEYQDQVFEMFERLHTHTEYEGSGIGLTVCRRIMLGYGGRISLNSSQGEGTTFTLSFPPREIQD